jgi:hypothetical protein
MTMLGEEHSGHGESGQKNLRERHEIVVAHHHRCFPANFTRLPGSANMNLLHHAVRHRKQSMACRLCNKLNALKMFKSRFLMAQKGGEMWLTGQRRRLDSAAMLA